MPLSSMSHAAGSSSGVSVSFVDEMLGSREVVGIMEAIHELPFIQELLKGTLSLARFRYYLEQDAVYLHYFSKALALLAAKSDDTRVIADFCQHAIGAVVAERALHQNFFRRWTREDPSYRPFTPAAARSRQSLKSLAQEAAALELESLEASPEDDYSFNSFGQEELLELQSPTTMLYTGLLMRVVYERPIHEGIAAVLPCFWVYREVGKRLFEEAMELYDGNREAFSHPTQGHPYAAWIETYQSDEFDAGVEKVLQLMDSQAESLTQEQRSNCRALCIKAIVLEWKFWNAAYEMETWPSFSLKA